MSVLVYICAAGAALAFFGPTLKCVPGMWHIRVLYTIVTGKFLRKKSHYPLFQPDVLTSRVPIFELDIQMHKTNSSYFSDLDESRLRLLFSLCPDWLSLHGKRRMAMGGTSCTFYQAIAPFQAYEVRSQVLCWDKKWLYISSDFLKFGSSRQLANVGSLENELRETSRSRSRIIASAITKYCFKLNCFTVAPDIALKEKMLLATESSNALERRNAEGMRFARSVTTLGELRDRLDIVIVG